MDIGLLDQDAISSPDSFLPNLEIMKLSTYYKKNKNYVSFILDPSKIERYTKIILRKNLNDGSYLSNILLEEKCEYGGLAFTNGVYVPLPLEIENSVPDIAIYNPYFKKILAGKKKYEDLKKKLLNSSFIRLSSDGRTCNLDYSKGFIGAGGKTSNIIYIYDSNILNIDCAQTAISDIILGKAQVVFLIYPQYSDNFDKIENWCKKKWNYHDNKIIYNKTVLNKEFKEICEKSINFHLKPTLFICDDKNKTYTENFLKIDFRNSLNKTIYIMTRKAKIKFMCKQEPEDNNFRSLYRNLILWCNKSFGGYSFKDYLLSKNYKNLSIFLDNLAKDDAILREFINVVPNNIRNKGGKWLL